MKKLLQRVFGVTASAVLLLTSALPSAFADGHQHHSGDKVITKSDDGLGEVDRYKITLTDIENYGEDEVEFGAYQIFTGTVKNGGTEYTDPGNYVGDELNRNLSMIPLTDIKWGNAFGDFNGSDNAAKQKIVEFVYALATPPTEGEYAAAFTDFHGFDGKPDGSDLSYGTFAGSENNTLADRFYTDATTKIIANVKFDKLATEVADVINKHNDRTWLQAFTDILGGYGKGSTEGTYAEGNFVTQCYGGNMDEENYVIDEVPEGYYMILDRTDIEGKEEAYSARMLFVANNVNQVLKEDIPTLDKEIVRDDNKEYKTEAAGVGDEVNFRLTGQLPSNYDQYTLGYQFTFTDELSKGLTLKDSGSLIDKNYTSKITVTAHGLYVEKDGKKSWDSNAEQVIEVSNFISSAHTHTTTSDAYKATVETNEDTGVQTLTVNFPCLKEISKTEGDSTYTLGVNGDEKSVIYIDYTAVVNENAIVSPTDGNKNTAKLTYSDNPQSYGDTDDTTPKQATVYTFGLDIVKVDAADFLKNAENPEAAGLSGAKFILVRPTATENKYEIAKFVGVAAKESAKPTDPFKGEKYYSIDSWEELGTLDKDGSTTPGDKTDDTLEELFNKLTDKLGYELETYSDTGVKGHLNISGLDSGVTYTIAETATPEGDYAKINPFTIELTAQMNEGKTEYTGKLESATSDQNIEAGKSFSFDNPVDVTETKDADSDGSANMIVANFKYIDLPSTGGVGTYWFYILGAGGLAISFVLFRLSRKKIVQ